MTPMAGMRLRGGYAFEPSPKTYGILKKNVAINGFENVVLEHSAVSDVTGTASLHLPPDPKAHSISGAVAASRRLFGLPGVVAAAQALPFADGSFDAAQCLGVLCTLSDKAAALDELRRVLADDARRGWSVEDGQVTAGLASIAACSFDQKR